MKFIYRGEYSKGRDTLTVMAATFTGREPSEVTDVAAINWFNGHPEYEAVIEPVDDPEPVATYVKLKAAKKPAKKAKPGG